MTRSWIPAPENGHNARVADSLPRLRRWGQNFLVDPAVARRILEAASISTGETVVEIGPGDGALTLLAARTGARILAVEIDPLRARRLDRDLPAGSGVTIACGDARYRRIGEWLAEYGFPAPALVLGNLPYNAATPILSRAMEDRGSVSRIVATVQKEVASRLTARPGDSSYGFLSLRCRIFADAQMLFEIPRGAFRPSPRVTSAVVRLVPREPLAEGEALSDLLRAASLAYRSRRKTLPNALASLGGRQRWAYALEAIGKSPLSRAEELSAEQFLDLIRTAQPE